MQTPQEPLSRRPRRHLRATCAKAAAAKAGHLPTYAAACTLFLWAGNMICNISSLWRCAWPMGRAIKVEPHSTNTAWSTIQTATIGCMNAQRTSSTGWQRGLKLTAHFVLGRSAGLQMTPSVLSYIPVPARVRNRGRPSAGGPKQAGRRLFHQAKHLQHAWSFTS